MASHGFPYTAAVAAKSNKFTAIARNNQLLIVFHLSGFVIDDDSRRFGSGCG